MEMKVDFEKIKEQLPQGAQTEIAKMANVANSTVFQVLKGKSQNIAVLNAIADYLEKQTELKESALNRIASIMDK